MVRGESGGNQGGVIYFVPGQKGRVTYFVPGQEWGVTYFVPRIVNIKNYTQEKSTNFWLFTLFYCNDIYLLKYTA